MGQREERAEVEEPGRVVPDGALPDGAPPNGQSAARADHHLPWLDGTRGLAALWVLLGHAQLITGMAQVPVMSSGPLAVDLFILISGYLMAHHYILREAKEPWEKSATWFRFWTRRYFRIAPLYYVLLAFALVVGPVFGHYRNIVAEAYSVIPVRPEALYDRDPVNILLHYTFLYGFWPSYSFSSRLPDWSIALEMQFYAAFVFLMLLIRRFGTVLSVVALSVLCFGVTALFHQQFAEFEKPTVLILRLPVFLAGMVLAQARIKGNYRHACLLALAILCGYIAQDRSLQSVMRLVLALAFAYLMDRGELPLFPLAQQGLDKLRSGLGGGFGRFMGDTSYGVYLIHLLILVPFVGWMLQFPAFAGQVAPVRFFIALGVVIPGSYVLAYVVSKWIEVPGINLGKRVVQRLKG